MNELIKRVAFLRGLAEGMSIDGSTDQGKFTLELLQTLDMFATAVAELSQEIDELSDYVEDLDESVSEMEEALLMDDDEDDEEEGEGSGDGLIEYDCPHCEATLFFDEDTFSMEEEHVCPNCGKPIFDEDKD